MLPKRKAISFKYSNSFSIRTIFSGFISIFLRALISIFHVEKVILLYIVIATAAVNQFKIQILFGKQ